MLKIKENNDELLQIIKNPEGFKKYTSRSNNKVLKYLTSKEIAYLKGVNTKIQKAVETVFKYGDKNYKNFI